MTKTFTVANVRCGGCANMITINLTEAGFENVKVDLSCEPRKVTSNIKNEVQEAQFRDILTKLGYPLVDDDYTTLERISLKAKSFISCAVGKFELSCEKNN